MPAPRVRISPEVFGPGRYVVRSHTIEMSHFSVVTLLHEFRHAMQYRPGIADVRPGSEEDARAWSLSLFRLAAPRRFRRMCDAGRIIHCRPRAHPAAAVNYLAQALWAAEHPLSDPSEHAENCAIWLPVLRDSCTCGAGANLDA